MLWEQGVASSNLAVPTHWNGLARPILRCRSLLIATGANVKYAQGQLGHTSAAMTLDIYSVLWEQAGQAEQATVALEARFAASMT